MVTNCKVLPDWSKRDAHCIGSYQYELELALARINIPSLLLDGGADLMSDAVEKITTRRREGVGVVVETKEESRRTFQQKSVWFTYSTKQINNLTRKQNYESKTVDVSMM